MKSIFTRHEGKRNEDTGEDEERAEEEKKGLLLNFSGNNLKISAPQGIFGRARVKFTFHETLHYEVGMKHSSSQNSVCTRDISNARA